MYCKNNRGISLLSVPGKVYGRILIERVIENSERQIGEGQSGFRKGRSCADQIFVLRQICEKIKEEKIECMWHFHTCLLSSCYTI